MVVLLLATAAAAAEQPDAKVVFFCDNVRPLLQRCVACHSGDEPTGGMKLTMREGALKGGEHGPVFVPGDLFKSLCKPAVMICRPYNEQRSEQID